MKLEFLWLSIANFGSFNGGPHELDLGSFGPGCHFLRGRNEVEPRLGANGCLAGKTLIDCPRDLIKYPQGIPIKDLVGKSFLTYSWDFDKDTLTLSKVNRVWKTGRKQVYRVKLSTYPDGRNSNGIRGKKGIAQKGKYIPPCELIGTYDHLILLNDGSWRKLGELQRGDSLKSLYRREADRGKLSWSSNIRKEIRDIGFQKNVKNPLVHYNLTKGVVEQQFVCTMMHGPRPKGTHAHHLDENEHNHSPENIIWKNKFRHLSDHTRKRNLRGLSGWQVTGVHPRGMLGKNHKDTTKVQMGLASKRGWTEERRKKHRQQWRDKQDPRLHDLIWLLEQYKKQRTTEEIASELSVSGQTVRCKLRSFGINLKKLNHKVISIEALGKQDVYDMEVEGTSNFVANGVFVHNSGKSTLFSALCWCLYGRTVDGRRNPDIQPRFGDKKTSVFVVFHIDGKEKIVTRTANPNRLTIDGKEVGQEQVDQLIGLDFSVFSNTILLGQGQPLFFDLPPKAKMDLFSNVLNLDRWEARSEIASERTNELQQEESALVAKADNIEAQIDSTEKLYQTIKQKWVEWRDELERQKAADVERLKVLKEKLESLGNDKAGYELAYDSVATELKAAQNNTRTLSAAGEKLVLDRTGPTSQKAIAKSKLVELRNELDLLGEADSCPTCGQSIKGTDLSKHKAELKRQIDQWSLKAVKATNQHDILTLQINENQSRLNISRKAETDFQHKAEDNRDQLDQINPVISKTEAEIAQLVEQAKKQDREVNPYTEQTNELRRKKTQLETDHKEVVKQLNKLGEQIERTKFWIKGFKEVRLFVIAEVLAELELVTNAALPDIGLIDWEVRFAIEKETKSGTIQRGLNVSIQGPQDKAPVRWECWSGGEGQRLRLIGALALSEVLLARAGVETNMEILDEPTRSLSEEGVEDLCEFLADRARQLNRMTFYIDHVSVESARFASVTTIIKTKNGSEIERP